MKLSDRQQRMYDFIRDFFQENQYPPTIREIGEAVDISSTSVVNYNLNKLVEAGLIERNKEVSRGIRLSETPGFSLGGLFSRSVPILGHIAAGQPITVFPDERDSADTLDLASDVVGRAQEVYALRVQGDSMIDALVDSGDLVILNYQKTANNGDMVAAWLTDREETTLKYFFLEGNQVRLQPANANYDPIIVPADKVEVQGKVIAIIRQLG
ncbi:MAG: transcriptional repressor LexA [Anaerolineae bacterium]|nr:transcriptional repressor LexA [Anaerolineae bacterium]MCB9129709.1 transcriptional repressor LexA [Anaerolineales bacterium]MCB0242292.1 transcriptional repressor LexA [Anaerolineae bacterium]MCB0248073.1 transcriptional repressor LexA [Anaerolineae bacterium]MCO5245386.1 transcriptional repressor LexA [Anaerolineae bacterium]